MAINKSELYKKWVHSHEEDTDAEMVFRPDTYHFPPSRNRTSFDLKSDGSLYQSGIAPDDRRSPSLGSWNLRNESIEFYNKSSAEVKKTLKISSLNENKLVIKK
jgi:hypothetical protein